MTKVQNKKKPGTVTKVFISIMLIIILCLAILIFGIFIYMQHHKAGIFSWDADYIIHVSENDEALPRTIGEIYQMFDPDSDKEEVAAFAKYMSDNDISVYSLSGERDWYMPGSSEYMLYELRRVDEYNALLDEPDRIRGVVFDIEPYVLPEWENSKSEIMEQLINELGIVYSQRGSLEVLICIPYYYDDMGLSDSLEKLIGECCDGVMVMNYYVGNETPNIQTECELCRRYDKRLINIYELQKPDANVGIGEINTYAGRPHDNLLLSITDIICHYHYDKMSFAFHELGAFEEYYYR